MILGFPGGSAGKESAYHAEDPPEKGKATYSSILAWRIPWTLQSMGPQSWTQPSGFHKVWYYQTVKSIYCSFALGACYWSCTWWTSSCREIGLPLWWFAFYFWEKISIVQKWLVFSIVQRLNTQFLESESSGIISNSVSTTCHFHQVILYLCCKVGVKVGVSSVVK